MKEKWLKKEGEDGKDILKLCVCAQGHIHKEETDRIREGDLNGE